jgi:predicted nucleic acid-binding protein
MPKRTYLDSSVLLAAFKGNGEAARQAMQVLDDPERALLLSEAVWLEVMPKPLYEKQQAEVEFYETIFAETERLAWNLSSLARAARIAQQNGIAAMDAIHLAHALDGKADEFVTAEKPGKPLFRVRELAVQSIRAETA